MMAKPLKIIRIPKTPASSFNQYRLASDLVKNQVRHAYQELQHWIDKYGRIRPEQITTEQEAADYMATVTRVLHPQAASKPRLSGARPAKSGISLEAPPRQVPAPSTRAAQPKRRTRAARGKRS
jgi:hypothetical protein